MGCADGAIMSSLFDCFELYSLTRGDYAGKFITRTGLE